MEYKPCTGQTSKTNPTPENKSTSNEVDTSPSSSSSSSKSSEGSSKEEKKERANQTKPLFGQKIGPATASLPPFSDAD
ncbi:hypothetical protein L1987_58059 [Smallanthus sonchifolius]|uniref:Uncharacterized protein n=1 Tax=Smallanthus sonchifolius TaxID=185202 RepID=A0ACB9DEK7_9ASTR|nr:hypothetical protein L1987_58059 [Smallanthus sonchifolius]